MKNVPLFLSTLGRGLTWVWRLGGALVGAVMVCAALLPSGALASQLMALEHGCFNCHSNPPQRTAPSFQHLANEFSGRQGQSDAASEMAEKLRQQHFFGGIDAHERLSQYDATMLIQWVIDGAK